MSDEREEHADSGELNARGSALQVLSIFARLGFTSFGGPVAHLGYFREEFVERRKWIDEQTYADIVALCQFLPGPASSQVGIAIGLTRAGIRGALSAWLGFTLPSAIVLILFAYGVSQWGDIANSGWLDGLKIVAVAVVAQALWGMANNLCPDRERATIAIGAAIVVLAWPVVGMQVGVIVLGGIIGWLFLPRGELGDIIPLNVPISRGLAIACFALFFLLLGGLPLASAFAGGYTLDLVDSFYRTGSLVFGGGHVVLPLIQSEVVPPGWVSAEDFVAGYGAAQAVPGPLFTFSSYLGAVSSQSPAGWIGGGIALVSIFIPSFLLVFGALPFWDLLRSRLGFQSALRGINAGVVGLLLAALYDPVFTSAITRPLDFALALVAFAMLVFWKLPPWLVVVLTAAGGAALAQF
ncbi:MAG: chromate efflux transporter [Thermomicrobiaceae bacterium]